MTFVPPGGVNDPAAIGCADVIVVFGRASVARPSHDAAGARRGGATPMNAMISRPDAARRRTLIISALSRQYELAAR